MNRICQACFKQVRELRFLNLGFAKWVCPVCEQSINFGLLRVAPADTANIYFNQ